MNLALGVCMHAGVCVKCVSVHVCTHTCTVGEREKTTAPLGLLYSPVLTKTLRN